MGGSQNSVYLPLVLNVSLQYFLMTSLASVAQAWSLEIIYFWILLNLNYQKNTYFYTCTVTPCQTHAHVCVYTDTCRHMHVISFTFQHCHHPTPLCDSDTSLLSNGFYSPQPVAPATIRWCSQNQLCTHCSVIKDFSDFLLLSHWRLSPRVVCLRSTAIWT